MAHRGRGGDQGGDRGPGDRRGRRGRRGDGSGRPEPAQGAKASIAVGETENKPELLETLPIVTAAGTGRRVVLSLGPGTKSDLPMPDLAAGDRLLAFAELELTTDADDPNHPGLIGNAYSYAPSIEATLLLAPSASAAVAAGSGAIALGKPWRRAVTHRAHHAVITFGDLELEAAEALAGRPAHLNLVVEAQQPRRRSGAR